MRVHQISFVTSSFLTLALAVTSAQARTLVVDNVAGSDRQNDRGLVGGQATYGPYRTIMRALLAAKPGDTISLVKNEEPYRECVSLNGKNHSGTDLYPFRFEGNGATLDGSIFTHFDDWEFVGSEIYRYRHPRHGFAQLMLDGKSLKPFQPLADDLSPMPPMHWARQNGYIYFRPAKGKSPADDRLEITTEAVGISLFDVEHVIIENLTVRGYRQDGINLHDKANNIQLIQVAARHNGRSGLSIGGSSSVLIGASLSELNGVAQLRTEGHSTTQLANVDLPAAAGAAIDKQGGRVIKIQRP